MHSPTHLIACPACGNGFFAEVAASVVQCPGCGKKVPTAGVAEVAGSNVVATVIRMPGSSEVPSESGAAGHSRRFLRPMVVAAVIGLIAIVAMTLSFFPRPRSAASSDSWEQTHRDDLHAIRISADQLAAGGHRREAMAAYNRFLSTVGDYPVHDARLTADVSAATKAQNRIMTELSRVPLPTMPRPTVVNRLPTTVPTSMPVIATIPPATLPTVVVATTAATEPTAIAATKPEIQQSQIATTGPTTQQSPLVNAADLMPPLPNPPPPPTLRSYTLPDVVTDEQIGQSIERAMVMIRSHFNDGTIGGGVNNPHPRPRPKWAVKPNAATTKSFLDADDPKQPRMVPTRPGPDAGDDPGIDALSCYALLQGGQATNPKTLGPDDPFTMDMLDCLKQYNLGRTYHRSLRAAALSVHHRDQDMTTLEEDVGWLIQAHRFGAYTYTMPTGTALGDYDNSNSQYGLLGVWAGAAVGIKIPQSYWYAVDQHWVRDQDRDGSWNYRQAAPTGSLNMTCAGIASMLVARDYLDRPPGPADRGLDWMDQGDNCYSGLGNDDYSYYGLYGVERVGLASGYKYFGKHDWYSELARELVNGQRPDGGWGSQDDLIGTSYALLFLSRGRHPILFNKLRYSGQWQNHPRDLQHLSTFATAQLEKQINWQVVNLRKDWWDWLDAPVLYIAGQEPPAFTTHDYDALRSFVEAGGLILTHADYNSPAFNKWAEQTAHKLFPRYEYQTVPPDSPLYSVMYKIKSPPKLQAVSNGSRLLMIHSPTDIAQGWQLDMKDVNQENFRLGLNLFVYAAGKSVDLNHRLASTYIPPPPGQPNAIDRIAKLKYAAEWDPEPYALTRFGRFYQWETHRELVVKTVDTKLLKPDTSPMAVLTGTVRYDFTDAEVAAIHDYVESGGVLVIDTCGGQTAFAGSVQRSLLAKAFPDSVLEPLPAGHPALICSRPGSNDLRNSVYRPYALDQFGKVPLTGFTSGKGRVIFSRLDLTTGLLGTQSWGIAGFDPAYCQALMKNLVLWSAARAARGFAVATPTTVPVAPV